MCVHPYLSSGNKLDKYLDRRTVIHILHQTWEIPTRPQKPTPPSHFFEHRFYDSRSGDNSNGCSKRWCERSQRSGSIGIISARFYSIWEASVNNMISPQAGGFAFGW